MTESTTGNGVGDGGNDGGNDGGGNDRIAEDIRKAVESGMDIQDEVRRITLKALSEGEWDTEAMRAVAHSVADGARQGAETMGARGGDAMKQAMTGLDAALAKAAQATQLALEEAASRTREYSAEELQTTLDNLEQLESMFFETVNQAAREGSELIGKTLDDLAGHMRNSGSAVGRQVKESLDLVGDRVAQVQKEQMAAGLATMRTTGAMMSRLAAGMLTGLADALQPQGGTGRKKPGGDDTA